MRNGMSLNHPTGGFLGDQILVHSTTFPAYRTSKMKAIIVGGLGYAHKACWRFLQIFSPK